MTTTKKIKIAGLVAAALFVALVIFAFTIPRDYHYESKADIIAQQRMVFVFIGELQRWVEWSPWAARDPDMLNTYSEPSWGIDATYRWKSTWQGVGEVKVTNFIRDIHMAYDLTPDGWEPSKWEFKLGPAQRQGTTVTWSVTGQYPENRIMRLVAYFMMWGLPKDIETGLQRLKKHAENHEAYSVKGGWE